MVGKIEARQALLNFKILESDSKSELQNTFEKYRFK
jgi:hypothetical protein